MKCLNILKFLAILKYLFTLIDFFFNYIVLKFLKFQSFYFRAMGDLIWKLISYFRGFEEFIGNVGSMCMCLSAIGSRKLLWNFNKYCGIYLRHFFNFVFFSHLASFVFIYLKQTAAWLLNWCPASMPFLFYSVWQ